MVSISSISSIVAAGICFMLANLAMKLFGDRPFYVLYPMVAAAMIGGCYLQVLAFKGAQFAFAVVLILGLEMIFSVLIARAFLGETYSTTNLAGVLLVIAGMGLVHVPAGTVSDAGEMPDGLASDIGKKGPRPGISVDAEPGG